MGPLLFEDAVARLAGLPPALPPPPAELRPVVLPSPSGDLPEPPGWWSEEPAREAAVLLLVHPDEEGEARIVLTERSAGGHRHAGQVSFPGGAIDPTDESVVAAALREAHEEVGLNTIEADVRVSGVLAPVGVRVSGFLVHPVLATAGRRPRLVANRREVSAILHAPVGAFLPATPIELVTAERDGLRLRYGAYRIGEHLVWGATAHMLGGLGALLSR